MKKYRFHLTLVVSGILLVLAGLIFNLSKRQTLDKIAFRAGLRIESQLEKCALALDSVQKRLDRGIREPDRFFEENGIALYFYENDKLTYWNSSNFPVNEDLRVYAKTRGFIGLNHGYYLYHRLTTNNREGLALCLLKPEYPLQNNYLDNSFGAWTGIPEGVSLDGDTMGAKEVTVYGKRWFSLKGSEESYYSEGSDHVCLIVFILGFILLLLAAVTIIRSGQSASAALLILLLAVLVRAAMLYFKWPAFFYRTSLYDVRLFGDAQSVINGHLGDMLLNAILLFFFSLSVWSLPLDKKEKTRIYIPLSVLLVFLGSSQYNQNLVSIVTNSTLNFNFTDIFNVKIPVFVALLTLGIYSLSVLLSLVSLIRQLAPGTKGFLQFLSIVLSVGLVYYVLNRPENLLEVYWIYAVALVMFFCYRLSPARTSVILGVHVILLSVVTSVFLNYYIHKNQNQNLDILSLKLSEKTDAILENEYLGIPAKLSRDANLGNLINLLPDSKEVIGQNLKQKFFSGYFDRYNLEFSLFDENCKPLLDPKQAVLLNEGFFEDKIRLYSDSVGPGLFFLRDNKKNAQYIGRVQLKTHRLYVLMEPKQFEEVGSFPDLLLDQSLQKQDKLKNFSYVVYQSRQSASRYGNFNYPFFFQDSTTLSKTNEHYTHFYFRPDPSTDIVISKRSNDLSYFFTFNSYLLLFFSLVTYGGYVIYARIFTSLFRNSSLTRRIQTIIVFLLLLAMSAVGITSGKLVIRQFEADNKKQLHEKTDIIIAELSDQYSTTQLFDESQKELLNLRIKEYSRLFNTPISLFSKEGLLLNTSEPKLYDYGLAPARMNAKAFYNLSGNRLSAASVNEKAGSLNYLSYYTPLFDSKKQLAGFINLPYFAKQSDLTDELSGIISALINVYVILFVLSIVAGLFLATYITRPLQLIKQQFSKITLGRQNEKLVWPANDEIGKLVFEYNQMLIKLEESANLLAKSEREGAWREMAKQVAHEIKNPLTPMKLNLQYLQHLIKSNPEDFRDKFEKASAGIIEQIDSLANIATEFSNFAKLPGAQLQTIDLTEIINTSVTTFGSQKNVNITNQIAQNGLLVRGDKDQCLRVFNNILKNAQQAVEDCQEPGISIRCEESLSAVVVAISDNGCGIDEGMKEKIFTPNFTTKTTGSGLGLAMVKNIMQGFGGRIWFESEKDSGTTFFLEFKKA